MACNSPRCGHVMEFMKDLTEHNERRWFAANKSRYEAARQTMLSVAGSLIEGLREFDSELRCVEPQDCLYRIYRDVRFSPDKSPYKRHMGCYVNPRGRQSDHVGYYLHLQPWGESFVAGGTWQLPTPILKMLRQKVINEIEEFRRIVEEEQFRALYPEITDDPLKVLPRGVPRDFAYPEYLKCRSYCVTHRLDDDFFSQPGWMDEVVGMFRVAKPFLDFLNEVIDDYI